MGKGLEPDLGNLSDIAVNTVLQAAISHLGETESQPGWAACARRVVLQDALAALAPALPELFPQLQG